MDKKSKKILGLSVASIIAALAIIAPSTYFGLQKQEEGKKDINLDNVTRKIPGETKDDIKVEDLNNINDQNTDLKLDFSKVSIKPQTKINYLAIGDSITAGFNSELGWEAPGRYDPITNKISGLSFPSFIAQYINKVEPNRLASYENLGITGSRIEDWLYMLGAGSDEYFKNQEYRVFDFSKQMDQQKDKPFKNRLSKFFKNFGYDSKLTPKNNHE
ncbi:SGNH/GDSL hydrolase family protein, partial [Ureaplasma urealyticum]